MRKLTQTFGLVITLLVVCPTWVWAQQEGEGEGELEAIQIEINKVREITLPRATRLFDKIPPRPAEPVKPEIKYNFRSFSFSTPELNPSIRPLKLKEGSTTDSYTGYVSAGYGNYASPYLEGFINNKPNKNNLLGAHLLIDRSGKGPVDGKNSGGGNSGISVFGQTYGKELSFHAQAGYESTYTYFYGYQPDADVKRDSIKQTFNVFDLTLGMSNARNAKFQYSLDGTFSYLNDRYKATESMLDLDFQSSLKLNDESAIRLNANYLILGRRDAGVDAKPRSLFSTGGSYQFETSDNLKLRLGMIVAFENDEIDSKDLHVYPDVHVTYPLNPTVDVVGGLTGGIDAVSLHSLVRENLWLAPAVGIAHTNRLYDLSAGVRARFGSKVLVGAGLSYAGLKDLYFFVNDPTDQAKFVTVYDEGTTKRTNLYASVTVAHADVAKFMLRGDLYSYATDEVKDAYHRPGYRVTANAAFNVYKKILLSADIIAQGNSKALDAANNTITLDPAFDLNFKAEYLVSDKFSVFAEFNNITSNKYSVLLNYPVRGFQAMGGITWRF
jgi:hypothetical protein